MQEINTFIKEYKNKDNLPSLFNLIKKKKELTEKYYFSFVPSERFYYYGRFNERGGVIYPKKEFLEQIDSSMILNFLVNPFLNLKNSMNFGKLRGLLNGDNEKLQQIKVYNKTVDIEQEYNSYIEDIIDSTVQRIINQSDVYIGTNKEKINVVDVDSLLDFVLNEFTEDVLKKLPLTFEQYCSQGIISSVSFGLIIEIDNHDYNDEEYKLTQYYNNQDFVFFIKMCNKYGFHIDKNIPWRLYPKLNSPIVSESYRTIFQQPVDMIFKTCYNDFKNSSITVNLTYFINQVLIKLFNLNYIKEKYKVKENDIKINKLKDRVKIK